MKIIVSCIHFPVASGRYIERALKRLGHDVKTYGPTTGRHIWEMEIEEKYAWVSDTIEPDWKPDLIIHADSYAGLLPPVYEGVPVALWGVDNHVRDYSFYKWDQMFLAHSWGARMTDQNAHWLPPCYDPVAHTDQHGKRYMDAVMIGAAYPPRQEIVDKIKALGLYIVAGTGALWDEYNALYNGAKIAIVRSSGGDLAQRVFENMAQGCCVLCDYLPDLMRLGFAPYQDFWLYSSTDEAAHAARWLIESGDWARIAQNGQIKAQPHTWDNRAKQLLEIMSGGKHEGYALKESQ